MKENEIEYLMKKKKEKRKDALLTRRLSVIPFFFKMCSIIEDKI